MILYMVSWNLFELKIKNIIQYMKSRRVWAGIIFLALLIQSQAYLQVKLVRIPHHSKASNYIRTQCLSEISPNQDKQYQEDDQEQQKKVESSDDFQEICYEKDISYSIELYNKNQQLLLFSMDLTAPIGWMKGQNCHVTSLHKKCSRVEVNFKDEVKNMQKNLKQLVKNPFGKKPKKRKENQYALIEGSSEVVKGILQKTQDLIFETRDSGKLTRLADVILLGLAIIDQKDILNLHNTTFINATQISPHLNYLCDGAISLRFDQNSESSFLTEITKIIDTTEKYVTIFLGEHNQSLTIGDLSAKNSASGLSGIHWIEVEQHQKHGKLPSLKQVWITTEGSQSHKIIQSELPLVFTLSSSTIAIPRQLLISILSNLLKKTHIQKCGVAKDSGYVQCRNLTSSQLSELQKRQLNFVTKQNPITISIKQLMIQSSKRKTILNIREAIDSKFIILGEPIFQKYFIVLDYVNNRIGISDQRKQFMDKIIDVIFLIRFVVWIFIFGCCCILLVNPIDKCWRILRNKKIKSGRKRGQGKQGSKLKQYNRISDNPYDQLQGKIQEIVGNQEQVQGI